MNCHSVYFQLINAEENTARWVDQIKKALGYEELHWQNSALLTSEGYITRNEIFWHYDNASDAQIQAVLLQGIAIGAGIPTSNYSIQIGEL